MPRNTSSIATSRKAGAARSPSSAATSGSPMPTCSSASTGSDRRCATAGDPARGTRRAAPPRRAGVRDQLLRRDQDRRRADSAQHAVEGRRLPSRARRLGRARRRRQPRASPEFETIEASCRPRRHCRGRRSRRRARFERASWRGSSPVLDAQPTSRDAPAFWLYSSGSTGRPKGCVHLQHDMFVCAEQSSRKACSASPPRIAASASRSCSSPTASATRAISRSRSARPASSGPGRRSRARVFETIERYRPTFFFACRRLRMLLAHEGDFDLSGIRLAVSAGEALPPRSSTASGSASAIEILDAIGSTEACTCSLEPARRRPGTSGVIVDGVRRAHRRRCGQPVTAGRSAIS